MKQIIDSHNRRIKKLRVSLLDACNFRCFYCMPTDAKFMNASKLLSPDEIKLICSQLCSIGIEEIRVTGGEPTIRKEFKQIMNLLSALPIKKLGLTTNGFTLHQELDFLKTTRCQSINISLDSLSKDNFAEITRRDAFNEVIFSIMSAKKLGFNVKINTVLMKGVNDHEVLDFVRFSSENDIEVRFLELMKIGQACVNQNNQFIAADEVLQEIKKQETLNEVIVPSDSTSFNFTTYSGAKIGFIASESKPFCGSCSRWRLSADGLLRACLMSSQGVNIRGVKFEDYNELVNTVLPMKPIGRIEKINEDMNRIGG